MSLGDLFLILTVFGLAILVLRSLVQLASGRGRRALRGLVLAVAGVALYGLALVVAGLVSTTIPLVSGEAKCFDDWCLTFEGAHPTSQGAVLDLVVSNRGRRAQRPDAPRLFVLLDGKEHPLAATWLSERMEGGAARRFALPVAIPPSTRRADLLATEGGWPSMLSIGDENGPFHAKSMWRIRR